MDTKIEKPSDSKEKTEAKKKYDRTDDLYKGVQILLFTGALLFIAVISWIIPLRPTQSQVEKRTLTKFPAFSAGALAQGAYFDGINTWFADTFPFRDTWVFLSNRLTGAVSSTGTISITGDVMAADTIPSAAVPQVPSPSPSSQVPAATSAEASAAPTESSSEAEPEESAAASPVTETVNAILRVGDACYEYYTFRQDLADQYIATLKSAQDQLGDRSKLYELLVPTSIAIVLPESLTSTLTTSSQKDATDYVCKLLPAGITSADVYTAEQDHADEYIYYRTDHHWTVLGAYYGYEALCKAKGTDPASLEDDFVAQSYGAFLGSFYASSNQNAELAANPDEMTAYVPKVTNDMNIIQQNGEPLAWEVVRDVTDWATNSKYNCFIGGDNPWSTIENPKVTDGSSCIVIKESFGNALVPFLVPDYQYIYIVDYRYYYAMYQKTLADVVNETGAQDVIFINNMSMLQNESLQTLLEQFVG